MPRGPKGNRVRYYMCREDLLTTEGHRGSQPLWLRFLTYCSGLTSSSESSCAFHARVRARSRSPAVNGGLRLLHELPDLIDHVLLVSGELASGYLLEVRFRGRPAFGWRCLVRGEVWFRPRLRPTECSVLTFLPAAQLLWGEDSSWSLERSGRWRVRRGSGICLRWAARIRTGS